MKYLCSAGIFLLTVLLATVSFAYTIDNVDGISTFTVSGSDMAGMNVTIAFEGGTTVSTPWQSYGGDDGGVSGTFSNDDTWSLTYSGSDTYLHGWILDSDLAVEYFTIDGSVADIFFDFYNDKLYTGDSNSTYEGTPNSSFGTFGYHGTLNNVEDDHDIILPLSNADSMTGYISDEVIGGWDYTFSNPVALTNQSIVGDLYGTFQIDFGQAVDNFTFYLDTDMAAVPEPATMLLFGIGLFGLAGYGSRVRKVKKP